MGKKVVKSYFKLSVDAAFVLISLVAVTGYFIRNADPVDHALLPIIGLGMPFLLFFSAAGAGWFFLRRFYILIIFPVIAFTANISYLNGMYQFSGAGDSYAQDSHMIMTLNTAWFEDDPGYKLREIADYTEDKGVEILCFQESIPHYDYRLREMPEILSRFPYRVIPNRNDNTAIQSISIYSIYPIIDWGKIDFNGITNEGLWVDIQINDKVIRVFNVHMQTTDVRNHEGLISQIKDPLSIQKAELEMLEKDLHTNFVIRGNQAKLVKSVVDTTSIPTILCGDFNDTPVSFTYNTLKGSRLIDGFKVVGRGWGYTFNRFKGILRLDYILSSNDITPLEYYSEKHRWSDHNPVFLRFTLE